MNHGNRSRPDSQTHALVARLACFDRLVEIGIGVQTDVAEALAEDASITATDIYPCTVPEGVAFARDDVTDPDIEIYTNADAIYALNLPRELHGPAQDLAREVEAVFLFTTLGGEFPAIPTEPEMLPDETLFRATNRGEPIRGERA